MTEVLAEDVWRARAEMQRARVTPLIQPRLARRAEGTKHPVEDFLFEYYSNTPGKLQTWHPGAGVALGGHAEEYLALKGYVRNSEGVTAPIESLTPRRESLANTVDLLERTQSRTPEFSCFGRHEWAMVYQLDPDEIRHSAWPLRLTMDEISDVITSSPLKCTHFDAFRFYTNAAKPLNVLQPTRATQADLEQPGCLHAGMDLYKWGFMFSPWVPSELVVDCFMLAREIREVDMRVAPYDLSALGVEPIRIETAEGRAEFAGLQRSFSDRQQAMRVRVTKTLRHLLAAMPPAYVS
jgi:hypothetical protein